MSQYKLKLETMTNLDRLSVINSKTTDCTFSPGHMEAIESLTLYSTVTNYHKSNALPPNQQQKILTLISVHRFFILLNNLILAKSLLEIDFYSPKSGICSYNLSIFVYSHC